ncbi:hypothetical protein NQ317_018023 [Molorchus minor]|uniref:CCHC-type domain-containing protein n=1 Tax=Molorchus minor TaxID=1323400 RepID=A0ABQ9JRZ2_9CUCU|nr:hypothetical protein NQ317_018023 [Molorchus minor]
MPRSTKSKPREKTDSSTEVMASTPTSSVVMTNEQFLALIHEVREASKHSNEEFLDRVRASTPQSSASTSHTTGSFAKCTSRFDGNSKADVDAFLDSILTYKDCTNVSDDNALRGLSMLLEGIAATWWQGIKKTIPDWKTAVTTLKEAYSKKLPPPLVYRKIFAREQSANETTEMFVCHFRSLTAQLPYELTEEQQLDMVYGLLNRRIRKRLPRSEFSEFKGLLMKSRTIEQSLQEQTVDDTKESCVKTIKSEDKSVKKLRPRCSFCKNFGHNRDECRKLSKKDSLPETSEPTKRLVTENPQNETRSQIVCYGCGQPGVIRSKCQKCKGNDTTETLQVRSLGFYQVSQISAPNTSPRPLLPLTIAGVEGVGFADSGAQVSIAGHKLYQVLQENGYTFQASSARLSYADGYIRHENVLQTTVDVGIKNRIVPIVFTVLPNLENNHTLLGVDFLDKAKIVLNIPEACWYFCDAPDEKHPFLSEAAVPMELQVFEVNEQGSLRADEASSPPEK